MTDKLKEDFIKIYKKEASFVFFSPGRVNLIGEHIDYNGGLVMPCAITFGTWLLAAPNNDQTVRLRSMNFDEYLDIPIQPRYEKAGEKWFNYPLGIMDWFLKEGHRMQGFDILFYGDIPISSGLSSSASIEVVTAFALNDLLHAGYNKLSLVKLSQAVENNFIGVNCGIMDQFAVAFGEKNKALMLNCDTLEYKAVNSNLGKYVLAIINTNKPRNLAGSKYNERVKECQAALSALKTELDINNLCDIDTATFNHYSYLITDKVIRNRAKHVVEENERVKLASEALNNNDLVAFGALMYASHTSLQELYEVSGKELDTIVEYCQTDKNVAGARMTGAGFGGCAIALVRQDAFETFSENVTIFYAEKIGYPPSVYRSLIGDGVREINYK